MANSSDAVEGKPRIVICGAGFAGAYCARELARLLGARADILVIDAHNYFVFHPLLVEAGVGHLEPRHVIVPLRSFLTRQVRLRMGELISVDPDNRRVDYRIPGETTNRSVAYTHLVLGLGSVTAFPPIPGLRENAFQVKSLGDAIELRDHVIGQLERANLARTVEDRRRMLRMVVVGASYTGSEVAGEFQHYLHHAVKSYRNLRPEDCQIILMERGKRILPALSADLAQYAAQRLTRKGVEIRTGRTISRVVEGHRMELDDGTTIDAETLVWCAGIAQNPVAATLPFPKDQRGILQCEVTGQIKGHDSVWGIGDCAANPMPAGGFYPPTAQAATRLGIHAARNIVRAIDGKAPRPIRFADLGSLCVLGSYDGVAKVMGIPVAGFLAWWLWRSIYLMKMPGFGRKLRVAADWTVSLFSRPDVVQVGLRRRR
jgi:NADH dehydrogenase